MSEHEEEMGELGASGGEGPQMAPLTATEIAALVQAIVQGQVEAAVNAAMATLTAQQLQTDDSDLAGTTKTGMARVELPGANPRFAQMLRTRAGSVTGQVYWDIRLPGGNTSLVARNGATIAIDSGEISQVGMTDWWHLVNCDGSAANPTTAITAMARPGSSDHGDWAVNPSATVKIKFYTQAGGNNVAPSDADAGVAGQWGLVWLVGYLGASGRVVQEPVGVVLGCGVMGDADTTRGSYTAPLQSIKTASVGVLQIANWGSGSGITNDGSPMLVSQSGVAQLMKQPTALSTKGDSDVPTTYSIHVASNVAQIYGWTASETGVATSSSDTVLVNHAGVATYAGLDPL
jgi:hypothetical protein